MARSKLDTTNPSVIKKEENTQIAETIRAAIESEKPLVELVNLAPIMQSVAVVKENEPPVKRYRVIRGAFINQRGSVSEMRKGAIVDELNYDIESLITAGIDLQLL